jgi:predicted nucleotidyltransferase
MIPEIRNNLDKIRQVCSQMQLESLAVVGSAARETDFGPNSDIDFMYSLQLNEQGVPLSNYDMFDFQWELEAITGKPVDLIYDKGIRNMRFLNSLMQDKVVLYEA